MQITLTSKEFDEAVLLWLKDQGFTTDRYDISTRVIAGRTDSGVGPRLEVTLDPVSSTPSFGELLGSDVEGGRITPAPARRFGHADE